MVEQQAVNLLVGRSSRPDAAHFTVLSPTPNRKDDEMLQQAESSSTDVIGTVLEGSVRKAGNRLRITVQLIDVQSQGHLWSQSYDRDFGDVFAVQSEIAK